MWRLLARGAGRAAAEGRRPSRLGRAAVAAPGAAGYASSRAVFVPSDGMVDTAVEHYKSDTQTLARWLDVSVVKKKGRAFEADAELLPAKDAKVFPLIKGYTLNSKDVEVPDAIVRQAAGAQQSTAQDLGVRLVAFSFKHYGFTLVRSWLTPFIEKFGKGPTASIPAIEICFVEYGFLSLTKNVFASNLKSQIDPAQHDLTALSFGGVMDFAAALQLPNKYTGYVYLLDGRNRVRWRGCGQSLGPAELDKLFALAWALLAEGAVSAGATGATAGSGGGGSAGQRSGKRSYR